MKVNVLFSGYQGITLVLYNYLIFTSFSNENYSWNNINVIISQLDKNNNKCYNNNKSIFIS